MTPENIMAGFRVTGVYPTDRFRILPKESTKPLTLCERTGLKFIPLLTPFHSRTRSLARVPPESDKSMDDVSLESPLNQDDSTLDNQTVDVDVVPTSQDPQHPFSAEEIMLFSKRREEGYDIKTDERYNFWLSLQTTAIKTGLSQPSHSSCHTVLSKVLSTLPPPMTKTPSFTPKSTARVVTSIECRHEINERERKKAEALKEKEERKLERERKKEEKKRLEEEKRREKQLSKCFVALI